MRALRHVLTTAGLLAALVTPSAASAAMFQVDDDAPPPGLCTAAVTCADLPAAVAAARLTAEADTIVLAPGTYSRIELLNVNDASLTIEGAGQSADPATGSTISYGGPMGLTVGTSADAKDLTMRNLRIVNTGLPGTIDYGQGPVPVVRGSAIGLYGAGTLLEDVTVDTLGDLAADHAIDVRNANITLRRVTTKTAGAMAVYSQDSPDALIADSTLTAGARGAALDVRGGNPRMRVERTRAQAGPDAESIVSVDADGLVLDSVLLTGGRRGALLWADSTLRHVTIDTRAPGVADPLFFDGEGDNGHGLLVGAAQVTLQSSIVLEPLHGGGISCAASDIGDLDSSGGMPDCLPAAGNTHAAPQALFVDGAAGDYRLKAGSPARDRGSAGGLAAGESATDLPGAARILDGDGDCLARRDQGAYEATDGANTPPVVSAITGGPGTVGVPLALAVVAADAQQGPTSLAYAWTLPFGGAGAGAQATLTPSVHGPLSAAVTVTDAGGCRATLQRELGVLPDTAPPAITRASVSPAAPRAGRAIAVRFTLSEAAEVSLRVLRTRPGRRAGRRCTARGRGRRCTRRTTVAAVTVTGVAGLNRVSLLRAIHRARLAPGSYRLELRARDASGNRSKLRVLGFRVRR